MPIYDGGGTRIARIDPIGVPLLADDFVERDADRAAGRNACAFGDKARIDFGLIVRQRARLGDSGPMGETRAHQSQKWDEKPLHGVNLYSRLSL